MRVALNQTKFTVAWLLICGAGLLAGGWSYWRTREERLGRLQVDAQRCAIAFSSEEVKALTGTRADLETARYRAIKGRLERLHDVHPTVRFVYLFRYQRESGKVIFLVDSEPEGSSELFQPGDEFSNVSRMPGVQAILRSGKPATEGPIQDSFDNRMTGYATVGGTGAGGDVPDILGLDISAEAWRRDLFEAGLKSALYVWLLLGLPVASLTLLRRYSSQQATIQKLSEAIEQSESAILVVDLQSRIEYANAGFCRQMGYSREELIGRNWRDFRSDATPSQIVDELVLRVRSGQSWEGDWINRRKNGELYPVRGLVSPVLNGQKKLVGFIGMVADMTEPQRQAAKLREAKETAEAGDKAKGHFLATMSHEVRTPLNGIVGFTNLLLETQLTQEQREYVSTIRSSGEALVQLTEDILDFSRIESGGLQLDASPCDLRACVEDALDIFANKAAEKGIHLLHWIELDVPTQVLIDAGRLRQVLVNLVGNAIKFTPRGEVEVRVCLLTGKSVSMAPFSVGSADVRGQLVAELEDGSLTIECSVRDTGIGISQQDQTRLFRPFTQLDASSVRRYGGAGLGLTISRNLVRLMGGEIWLESEPNQGSVFRFTVRVRPALGSAVDVPVPPTQSALARQRLVVAGSSPGLCRELAELVRSADAQAEQIHLDQLAHRPWDFGLIEVDAAFSRTCEERTSQPAWSAERLFAIVPVTLGNTERQKLRSHFRMILNAPVHHRTLLELLARAASVVGNRTDVPVVPPPAVGLRVLVVEDNAVSQRLVTVILECLGCTTQIAAHGRFCLDALSTAPFDLILMDLHMPEMDGLTAMRQIRNGEAGGEMKDIWIIAVTSDLRSEVREMALSAGANDYLKKPVALAETEVALRKYLLERPALGPRI